MPSDIKKLFDLHRGKILGGLVGFFLALLIIAFGFWKSLFIILCVMLGIFIGWRWEAGGGFSEIREHLQNYRNRLK